MQHTLSTRPRHSTSTHRQTCSDPPGPCASRDVATDEESLSINSLGAGAGPGATSTVSIPPSVSASSPVPVAVVAVAGTIVAVAVVLVSGPTVCAADAGAGGDALPDAQMQTRFALSPLHCVL